MKTARRGPVWGGALLARRRTFGEDKAVVAAGKQCHTGFTIVELLVVIAIIGLLVAITIPAVQAAREAARRAECQHKMRQLALSAHMFHESNGRFPPGQCGGPFGWGPDSWSWSWLARVLPYLEQTSLYQQGGIPNRTLRESGVADRQLAMLHCPTDSYTRRGPVLDAGNFEGLNFPLGQTNYKGVSGANWGADSSLNRDPIDTLFPNPGTNGSRDGMSNADGILWRVDVYYGISAASVRDGLSNTFLVGEDLPEHNRWCSWPYASHAYGTCAIPPNYIHTNTYSWENTHSFRSAHPGGLNFAMADGSTRFTSQTIDLRVYRALSTRAGGEVGLEGGP